MSDRDAAASVAASQAAAAPLSVESLAVSRRRTLAWLRAMVVLAIVLPALVFAGLAFYMHDEEFRAASGRLDRVARIAEEHGLKLFETNEMLLQRMLDLLGQSSDEELLQRSAELHDRLERMAAGLPQVQGLFIHGADGRPLASNLASPPPRHIDYRDRGWLEFDNSPGNPPLFISEQVVSRVTGEPAFDISRRRVRADGSLGSSVHVSLRPRYLTDFYQELATTVPGLRMAVLRSDGQLLARWPDSAAPGQQVSPDDRLMQSFADGVASGRADGPSTVGAVPRLRAFRKLGNYPVYAVAAVDRVVVLADWRRRSALLAAVLFPASLGFAWAAWLALKRTEEEQQALARLDDERSRRQRAELALLQSQKLEAMGRLTGGVAHDFNNLLMIVNSNLHLHRRLWPDAAASPQLAAIERAVGSGAKLTRQLLAFARKQALLPERTALQERLPALLELLRPVLGSSVALQCTVAADTAPIEVDAAELELALINLAVNAKDAMQGSGRLQISARNAGADELPPVLAGDFVTLDVADNGPGIAPAIADRVFEPFFTTKPLGQGTGLGLSQVQALCQSAGGAARIESRSPGEGGGARVRLFFKSAPAAPPAPQAAAPLPRDLNCRLLLVEDNEAVAVATRDVLESMGCKVLRVDSGQAALERLHKGTEAIELVLSDIEMPGEIDGIALATQLIQRDPPLPVLLMTGYAVRLEQAVQRRLDVLPKPCSPAMLADAIGKALARNRSLAGAAGG